MHNRILTNSGPTYSPDSQSGGNYFYAVNIDGAVKRSTNKGASWSTVYSQYNYELTYLGCSGNGQYAEAAGWDYDTGTSINGYKTSNYGSSWSTTASLCGAVAMSLTGQYQYTIEDTYYSYSSNYGSSFTNDSEFPASCYSICCSSSGQYVYAISPNTSSGSAVAISSNYGVTMSTTTTGLSLYTGNKYFVRCTANGQYVFVAGANGLFRSNNYGANGSWTRLLATAVHDVKVSSQGTYIIAGRDSATSQAFVSRDSGSNWDTYNFGTSGDGYYTYVGCDATGQYMLYSPGVDSTHYRSTDYGQNWSTVTIFDFSGTSFATPNF